MTAIIFCLFDVIAFWTNVLAHGQRRWFDSPYITRCSRSSIERAFRYERKGWRFESFRECKSQQSPTDILRRYVCNLIGWSNYPYFIRCGKVDDLSECARNWFTASVWSGVYAGSSPVTLTFTN